MKTVKTYKIELKGLNGGYKILKLHILYVLPLHMRSTAIQMKFSVIF